MSSEEEKFKKLINEALRKDRSLTDLESDEPFQNEQSTENRECIACRFIGDHADVYNILISTGFTRVVYFWSMASQ